MTYLDTYQMQEVTQARLVHPWDSVHSRDDFREVEPEHVQVPLDVLVPRRVLLEDEVADLGEAVGRAVRTSLIVSAFVLVMISLAVYGQSGNFNLAG